MIHSNKIAPEYDAIIVGARVAGAATAMLMARSGMKVLVVDRQQYGSDTLSTHALMRGAVGQLSRWGVLNEIINSGTPAIHQTVFHYKGVPVSLDIKPEYGVDALYAPRRTVLDRTLVNEAIRSGTTVLHNTSFLKIDRDSGNKIIGATIRVGIDQPIFVRAPLIIGADGRNSRVAQQVNAVAYAKGKYKTANIYGYFNGIPDHGYRWYYDKGIAAGIIPTNDGQSCVFASCTPERFRKDMKLGASALFHTILTEASKDLGNEISNARLCGSLHGFPGLAGFLRQSAGNGWALVGDAGYFKDPATAHGITDALRDAELLARAAKYNPNIGKSSYQTERDALSHELFKVTDKVASLKWEIPELQMLHRDLNTCMKVENQAMFGDYGMAA